MDKNKDKKTSVSVQVKRLVSKKIRDILKTLDMARFKTRGRRRAALFSQIELDLLVLFQTINEDG